MKFLFVLQFVFFLTFSFGQNIQNEQILDFDVLIEVDSLGAYTVTEKITVVSAGQAIKRGIYRSLPIRKKEYKNNYANTVYTIESILKDGIPESFHTKREGGYLKIYIGKKDVLLEKGIYQYSIQYRTEGHIGYYDDYDEVYWNVTGTEWLFPIKEARAKIKIHGNPEVKKMTCYIGSYGSTETSCTPRKKPEIEFSVNNLEKREGLTVAVGFEKGAIQYPAPPTRFKRYRNYIIILGSILLLLIYYIVTWFKHGRDHKKPAVYPIYEPPENMSPAYLASIYYDECSKDYFSSSILNLAVKGKIKIKEMEKKWWSPNHYTLTKTGSSNADLAPEELAIMESFQGDVLDFDGEYNKEVEQLQKNYSEALNNQVSEFIAKGKNSQLVLLPFLYIIFVSLFMIIRLSVPGTFGLYNFCIIFISILIGTIIFSTIRSKFKYMVMIAILSLIIGTMIYFTKNPMFHINIWLAFFIAFGIISIFIYEYLINKPTKEKLRLKSLIEGFKMYLSSAEINQIESLNSPELTPELFEKYLPYAMALKVGDKWGHKFTKYLSKSGRATYNHDWYSGYHSFSPNLYLSMNDSVNKSFNQSSTPSSGGGFSGGGGGGGGGGGW